MIPHISIRCGMLLAGTLAGVLLSAPAFAQQPTAPASAPPAAAPPAAAAALPPGSPLIGRPEGNAAAAKLAPVAAPPIPAAADKLPTAKLKVPRGFHVEVHDAPEKALSDGPNALRLSLLPKFLRKLRFIDDARRAAESQSA